MRVRAEYACTVAVRPGIIAVNRLKLERPPEHGVAEPRHASGFFYRPAHGFRGLDAFAFIRGRSGQERNCPGFSAA